MRDRLAEAALFETAVAGMLQALARYTASCNRAYATTVELGQPRRRLQGPSMVSVYLAEVLAGEKLALAPRQNWAKNKTLTDLISGQLATTDDA